MCPKCGSKLFTHDNICMKCGTYLYQEGHKPYTVLKIDPLIENREARRYYSSNVRGTCKNCERPNLCTNGGLCTSCRKAVQPIEGRRIERGSAEWNQRLRVIREKLNPTLKAA